ncbi:hypothetical protein GLOIN_2v1700252 [Rhizophagus irregularis DAOM 181602=DAOM 197198]|uniref:Uncharacterized protein n=1 Tax=Rhizophagus irregularis (strain DAOM 181602 / DAOM 197198 / MUCL 43194) TaxID=747089 RepID=A0A2P4P9D1_RHIID|nr:hypothetical protein GLOIN_2v1700252 [Rhizophagus irregularis DAOM 181602=DAOM 197198]POG61967.1 hypothetical protein GLOIN_2v1700252 [Rhizophagus irregularis DAOM 181602=DAOM 197198]|eukprot:XP_025168833.1 hypothetical protein GLOIN_2v1700252 [Rhizophagus irregularis DAOM 181602=DAOM 197198]
MRHLILILNLILIPNLVMIIHFQLFIQQWKPHIFGLVVIGLKKIILLIGLLMYSLLLAAYFL